MKDVDISWIKNKEEALQYYMNKMKLSNSYGILFLFLINLIMAPIIIIQSLRQAYRNDIIFGLVFDFLAIILIQYVALQMYKENLNRKEDFSYYDYLKNKNKPKKQFKLI